QTCALPIWVARQVVRQIKLLALAVHVPVDELPGQVGVPRALGDQHLVGEDTGDARQFRMAIRVWEVDATKMVLLGQKAKGPPVPIDQHGDLAPGKWVVGGEVGAEAGLEAVQLGGTVGLPEVGEPGERPYV